VDVSVEPEPVPVPELVAETAAPAEGVVAPAPDGDASA
jgi:hypothetical protein